MIAEWIVFGSIVFWVIVTALSLVFAFFINEEEDGACFFLGALFAAIRFLFGDMRTVVLDRPMLIVWLPIAYVAIGLLWCFPKWILFLDKIRKQYAEDMLRYMEKRRLASLIEEYWNDWSNHVDSFYHQYGIDFTKDGKTVPPQFCRNKKRITYWAMLWPWSILETVLGDVLKRFIDWCVGLYHKAFQAISNRMFKDL